MSSVLVILAEGFEEVEAVTPIDFLRRVNLNVTVAGLSSKLVRGSHGIFIEADVLLSEINAKQFDALIIPGGLSGATHIADSMHCADLIRRFDQEEKLIAAICAAPGLVLGDSAKILENRTATAYPGFEKYFPSSCQHSEKRVVVDRNLITSRGPGTAAEFSLAIIEYLVDSETAKKIHDTTLQAALC